MAFAAHHNGQLNEHNDLNRVLGCFNEREFGKIFEYSDRLKGNQWQVEKYPHEIYVRGNQVRVGKVLKTVAYIVIDEADDGSPVVHKWYIKNHRKYAK